MSCRSFVLMALLFVLGLGGAGLAQVDPDLIGWWRLDEGRGSTAADLSRFGNKGTLMGGPTWIVGQVGNALMFDGLDDYVQCAERVGNGPGAFPAELMPAIFTVACWTKLNSFAYFSSFVGNGIDTGDDECGFFLYNYGWVDENEKDFGLAIRTEAAMSYVETPNIYETNTWYHLAATYDGANVMIYVNGELAVGPEDVGGPMRWVSAISSNYPERFAIGVWLDPGYDLWVDGAIDDVRYYGRVLDEDEINAVMTEQPYYPLAHGPVPKHDAMIGATSQVLQWNSGDSADAHEVYFGADFDEVSTATPDHTDVFAGRTAANLLTVGMPSHFYPQGLAPGATYYWRVDEVNDTHSDSPWKGHVWSFSVQPLTAWKPYPIDGLRYVGPDQNLSWQKGLGAIFHTVYLGKTFDEVDNAVAGGWMSASETYDPGPLELDQTYYWRVDEVTLAGTHKGPIWSFTTRGEGGGVKAEYFNGMDLAGEPVLTQVEASIDHTWGGEVAGGLSDNVSARWTADLEAPFTETYSLITTSDDGVRLWLDGQLIIDNWTDHGTTSDRADVDLIAGQVYRVRMEFYENTGSAVARLSWESATLPRQIISQGWLQLPVRATSPLPINGEPHAVQTPVLRWSAGEEATDHDVYFGTDAEALANATAADAGLYRGRQVLDATTYTPEPLQWNTTYYWRIDEVDAANPESPWKGSVWSFTTADFIIVDDFESYTNDVGSRVFEVWVDGIGFTLPEPGNPGNGTGALVGHDVWSPDSPYFGGLVVETDDVHGGYQALPVYYSNTAMPYYSQAERTWATGQNWTVNGVTDLTLYVRGEADNDPAPLYVAIQDSAGRAGIVTHPDDAILTAEEWTQWKVPLSEFTNAGVAVTAVKGMDIGAGNRNAPVAGGAGVMYIDDIRVTKPDAGVGQ
ncbi:MAG: hypothetical protein JW741_21590 [Sedimentisphaerales bacterium]|nr:hypothetical protein [Sedimentisphaerales bacterium]